MKDFLTPKVVKLLSNFTLVNNLARQKCAIQAILAIIKTRSVELQELAFELNDDVARASNERRLQRFFHQATLQEDEFAFLLSLFLSFGKVKICIDRTEWNSGSTQVNLLVISGICQGMSIPLFIEFLDNKSGNSNCADRINLLEKVIKLLGKERIACFLADREFIGEEWFRYLIARKIKFFIRIPKHYLFSLSDQTTLKIDTLLKSRKLCRLDNITVLGIKGLSIQSKRCKNKKGEEDYLTILTNTCSIGAIQIYKMRWSIEAMFQDFKGQGFNLEATHLRADYKTVKLFYLVSVAYCFCLHIGFLKEKFQKKITLKKHGYRQYSIFRKGLDSLRELLHRKNKDFMILWHELVDSFIHYARIKILKINKL